LITSLEERLSRLEGELKSLRAQQPKEDITTLPTVVKELHKASGIMATQIADLEANEAKHVSRMDRKFSEATSEWSKQLDNAMSVRTANTTAEIANALDPHINTLNHHDDAIAIIEDEHIPDTIHDVNLCWQYLSMILDRLAPNWKQESGYTEPSDQLDPIVLDSQPRLARPVYVMEEGEVDDNDGGDWP
jgi:hypothetical protein